MYVSVQSIQVDLAQHSDAHHSCAGIATNYLVEIKDAGCAITGYEQCDRVCSLRPTTLPLVLRCCGSLTEQVRPRTGIPLLE